jgi:hydrogenase maturation protease
LTKKILLGLGNPVGRDDAVGLRVAEALRGTEWLSIPAPALENVLGLVEKEKPEKLVIVDAAEMGLPRERSAASPWEKARKCWAQPMAFLCPFLLSLVDVPEVVLIGIQPKEYGLGEGLSPEVQAAADSLIRLLRENREHEIPELNLGQH